MKRIKQLEENLINQIAAGEVIDRPASVVKELVENSIDAGSTKVEIEITNGIRDIRVADNGHGIYKDDVMLAFSRHATSKIQKQKDLWNINTLGFRGEALASIISVAKVTCITRTVEGENGVKVECKDSQIKVSEAGCAVGTIMEVKELFYNIPARLKFLKTPQTELSHITEILQNIAISHPEVAINLINRKHSVVKTSGSNELATTISEIYSKELIKELTEINYKDEQFGIVMNGFISNPDFTRSNKKGIYVFINGRTTKCPIISKALDTALKDLIPSGKYPFAVLNISMPSEEIDVNVHPSKKEVKYTKPNLVFNFVYSGIKLVLEGNPSFESLKLLQQKEVQKIPEFIQQTSFSEPPNKSGVVDFSKFADLKEDDIIEVSLPAPAISADISQNKIEFEQPYVNKKERQKHKIIGQFDNTYILIDTEAGLQVIDQHIAHERYLYEQLKEKRAKTSQLLLTTEVIEPDTEQITILQENTGLLAEYGFEFEFVPLKDTKKHLSENAIALQATVGTEVNLNLGVKLKKVPQILSEKNPGKILLEIIDTFQAKPEDVENEILESIACKAAVKAGEKLSLWQMEELIEKWSMTKFNRTCPHGRKIAHIIPKTEIAKFFGRQK